MALPASAPISFSQIKAEFSGPNNFRAYLGGGSYVPGGIGVPASGALHFSDFFGKSHIIPPTIFVSSGNYTVPAGVTSVRIVAVGGGGGGGTAYGSLEGGGGGGAGGLLDISDITVVGGQILPIIIGAGGAGGPSSNGRGFYGANGTNTTISNLLMAIGGGGGGGSSYYQALDGRSGGSGGGRCPFFNQGNVGIAATGQGNNGGAGAENYYGGGGGGAGGTEASAGGGGNGGAGLLKTINGTNYPLAAGGGGGVGSDRVGATPPGAGGLVGSFTIGGRGANYNQTIPALSGVTNTGSGGGGACATGGNGGSGIAFIIPNATSSGALYPIYSITGPSSINEDNSMNNFIVQATNVPNGTVLYFNINSSLFASAVTGSNFGIDGQDFTSGILTGSVTISSGLGTIPLGAVADGLTEGQEIFNIWLRTGSISGPVVYASSNIIINDTSISDPNANGGGG